MTKKIVPDPPESTVQPPSITPLNTFEDQLNLAADLLSSANATTYECGDQLQGQQRALAMASTYLIAQAQGVIEQTLEDLHQLPRAVQAVAEPS